MNERLQALKQRSAASHQGVQATLQKTAPKATLGGIKAAAEKKFGQRKTTKKQQQPKKQQPKKQPKPKAVSSTALDQWKQAMEKANIPKHRWRKLEDKISRLTGISRKRIEDILFDHKLFEAVYSIGEDEPELVDDYLSELEARVNELSGDDNKNVMDLINDAITDNPSSPMAQAILYNVVTKEEMTTALQVVSEKINVPADKVIKYAMYSTYDVEGKTPKEGTSPMVDFQLSANAVKAKYGIDITTPEGNEKFGDMLVFEAIAAANKQKIDAKASLEYNNRIEDMKEKGIEVTNKEKFELMTKTVLTEKDNDDTKLD